MQRSCWFFLLVRFFEEKWGYLVTAEERLILSQEQENLDPLLEEGLVPVSWRALVKGMASQMATEFLPLLG